MKTFLHGTTVATATKIIHDNSFSKNDGILTTWKCSDKEMLYLYPVDENDEECALEECTRLALESAQITAAYRNQQSDQLGVIELTMDDDIADEIISPDDSAPGMERCAQILKLKLNEYIQTQKVKCIVRIYKKAYISYMRPFYIMLANEKYLKPIDEWQLRHTIEIIKKDRIYLEPYDMGGIYDAEIYYTATIGPIRDTKRL
jgi:hypothetical protein